MPAQPAQGCTVRVTPRESLVRNGTLSFVFISLALFGSLYFLVVPLGTWPSVLAIHLVVTIASIATWVRYRLVYVGVIDGQLKYRGLLRPRWSVTGETVHSVTIVHTYRSNSTDTSAEFLARDADGKRVLRMRGLFWCERDMRAIADAVDREVDIRPDPLTSKQFLTTYPSSASWFEGRPVLVIAAAVLLLLLSVCTVLGLMALTGITVGPG